jgi:hypothetical protein
MKRSSHAEPRADTKADLQRLWSTLRKRPPGKIVGVRSKVAAERQQPQRPQAQ